MSIISAYCMYSGIQIEYCKVSCTCTITPGVIQIGSHFDGAMQKSMYIECIVRPLLAFDFEGLYKN